MIDAAVRLGNALGVPVLVYHGVREDYTCASDRLHAGDPRPDLETLEAMLRGETRDESWNACQRQFLRFGWMHNNLRMYWGKRIIAMTPDPETAWATACYLSDRLSLDGRDPSTYGNIAATFGGSPSDQERTVYGRVATRAAVKAATPGSRRRRRGRSRRCPFRRGDPRTCT